MKKHIVNFKKFCVGGMLAWLAFTGTAMACENSTMISKQVFGNGSTIIALKGDYSGVLVDTRKIMFNELAKHSAVSSFMELDIDKKVAISHIIIEPNAKISRDDTIALKGNLDAIDDFISKRPNWKVEHYEGGGHYLDPRGEAMISKIIE